MCQSAKPRRREKTELWIRYKNGENIDLQYLWFDINDTILQKDMLLNEQEQEIKELTNKLLKLETFINSLDIEEV